MKRIILLSLIFLVIALASSKVFSAKTWPVKGSTFEVLIIPEPITNYKILPSTEPIENAVKVDTISLSAARGEYEPASFVIRSGKKDLKDVTIGVTDLKADIRDEGGNTRKVIFSRDNIDIKVVKCWYQAGTAGISMKQDKNKKVLIPELLVNDDDLVKVDYEQKENYLKLTFPEGEKYIGISSTTDLKDTQMLSPIDYPVKDSPTLLPVNIPAQTNKQFWITIKIPENIEPGSYEGQIDIYVAKKTVRNLLLKVRVLPFKLAPPYYTSSIYYLGFLDPLGKMKGGSISSHFKSEIQLKKELEDMFAHGVTNPIVYQPFNKELLGKVLKMRNEVGMNSKTLYYRGIYMHDSYTPEELKALQRWVREVVDFCKAYEIDEVYFYGIDEAKGEALRAERDIWKAIHEAGGKVFVAGYTTDNYSIVGDIQNLLVSGGTLSKTDANKWHSKGHKIFSYANPQGGVENPEIYRRNYGILLWQNGYDGACTYAYQHAFGNAWNDFDHPIYRDHMFAYPTINGVVDTIQWEGYREGVDDVRYMTTLLDAIREAKKSANSKTRDLAREAEKYLSTLNPEKGNLYVLRSEIIGFVLKLKGY